MPERFSKLIPRVSILLAAAAILGLWVMMDWPCALRSLTGIPCPGCGLSRAWLSALRLDLAAACSYHPMFWSIPILVLYALFDGQLFRRKWLNIGLLALLLGGIAVSYVFRIVAYLSGSIAI